MNISANITQILRRGISGVLLASALTVTTGGLAATAHADDTPPAPVIEAPIAVPAPLAPWLPRIPSYVGGYGRLHCDFPGLQGTVKCWY